LTVVVAASLVAGSIGSYSLLAPGGLNLLDAQAGGRTVVVTGTQGQVAALVAYQRPYQRSVGMLAGGNRPSANRALPMQVLPFDPNAQKPITFSLFAGWGGAVTWDPNSGEVTVAFGVGRQFSLSVNDLPSAGSGKDDGSFFKGAGIQGEFGGKIDPTFASKVPGLQWAGDATITGKLNGKWSTNGTLTFRAIGQIKLPPDLASKLPEEVRPLFENGSMSWGYQWKVDTHGSADARQWTLVSGQTGYLDAQSYSFTSPGQSFTGSRAGTLAALGNGIFDFFKGGKFGGHVAANVTVALSPKLRDQINGYMHGMFGTYSKQVNQDTKKLQDSNGQLQKDLKKDGSPQSQQQIKSLGNQIGVESGQLQKDISQYQESTAQGVYDILNKYGKQPQKKSQQAPAPGLPPAKQNDPASGTRPPFNPPAGQSTTGAPPNPGGTSNHSGSGSQGGSSSRPGGGAQSGGTSIQRGPVQGLPGTQSGPAVTPPQPGTQSPPSTQPPRGQGAGSGAGQPGGSGTPVRSSGQQSSAGGSSGAVGGPGGQVPSLLTPPSLTPAPAGGVTLAPPSSHPPQPPTNAPRTQPPVLLGGSRPPASQPPAGNQPAGNQPAGGQTQQSGSGTPPSDTQGGGGQTQQTDTQNPPTDTQNPPTDTQTPPGTQPSGQVQGLPGTQSGPAATPPSQPPAPASGGNPDVNPDGTINTPPLDRTEPDGTPFQNVPTQPATPGQDPTKPPVIVPPPVADNGGGTQVAGQTPDGTPVITASAPATAPAVPPPPAPAEAPPPPPPATAPPPAPVQTAPIDIAPIDTTPVTVPVVSAPPPPVIEPAPIPVADATNPVVDSPATVDTANPASVDTADPSLGDIGTPAGVGGDVGSGGIVTADLGGGIGGDSATG
jgi:gas vesicle protein